MYSRRTQRTLLVVLTGALAPALFTSVALADPGTNRTPEQPAAPSYPFGNGTRQSDPPSKSPDAAPDERVKRAEEFGGGLAGEIIDLGAEVLKCGMNIATPQVKCPID